MIQIKVVHPGNTWKLSVSLASNVAFSAIDLSQGPERSQQHIEACEVMSFLIISKCKNIYDMIFMNSF